MRGPASRERQPPESEPAEVRTILYSLTLPARRHSETRRAHTSPPSRVRPHTPTATSPPAATASAPARSAPGKPAAPPGSRSCSRPTGSTGPRRPGPRSRRTSAATAGSSSPRRRTATQEMRTESPTATTPDSPPAGPTAPPRSATPRPPRPAPGRAQPSAAAAPGNEWSGGCRGSPGATCPGRRPGMCSRPRETRPTRARASARPSAGRRTKAVRPPEASARTGRRREYELPLSGYLRMPITLLSAGRRVGVYGYVATVGRRGCHREPRAGRPTPAGNPRLGRPPVSPEVDDGHGFRAGRLFHPTHARPDRTNRPGDQPGHRLPVRRDSRAAGAPPRAVRDRRRIDPPGHDRRRVRARARRPALRPPPGPVLLRPQDRAPAPGG